MCCLVTHGIKIYAKGWTQLKNMVNMYREINYTCIEFPNSVSLEVNGESAEVVAKMIQYELLQGNLQ